VRPSPWARAREQMRTAPPGTERRWGGLAGGLVGHPRGPRPDFGLSAPAELAPSVPALRRRAHRAARLRPTEEPIGPGEEPHLRHARSARPGSHRAPRRAPASGGGLTGDRAITRGARACDRHSGPRRVLETLHVILAPVHRTWRCRKDESRVVDASAVSLTLDGGAARGVHRQARSKASGRDSQVGM